MTIDARIAHFDRLYREDPDPWNHRTSGYERAKYGATLSALGDARFLSAIEAGCGNGELGALIAAKSERYLGLDCAARAVAEARRRLAHVPQARVRQCFLPRHWPKRRADLIVLSEILYYLDYAELGLLAERLRRTILPGGRIVIVNWSGSTGTALSGRESTCALLGALGACCSVTHAARGSGYDLMLVQHLGDDPGALAFGAQTSHPSGVLTG